MAQQQRERTFKRKVARAVGYPLAFTALCSLACGPGYAIAAEAANDASTDASGATDAKVSNQTSNAPAASLKDEAVYVFSKADGSVKNVTVSDKLTNSGGSSELADSSTLTNIENVEGSETYRGSGASMVWDAHGSDIYYRGDTDAELPVAMRVTYRLDGRTVTAAELAGKSGRVEISYAFENRSKVIDGVKVPFAAITAMMLDDNSFRNVEVDHGKVVDDGDRVVVVGYAMPGLADSLGLSADDVEIPEGFTVSADVTDFELSSTLTMVTGNLFDSVDFDDLDDLDADELNSASGDLKDAMSQLMDGAGELSDGLGQLAEGAGTLADGTAEMQDKASALPDGVQQLYNGSGTLAEGLNSMADGTSALASGASAVSSGADTVESGARQLDGGLAQLSYGLGQMSDGATNLSQGASAVSAGATKLADEQAGIPAIIATVKKMQASGAAVPTEYAQIQALEGVVKQSFEAAGTSDYAASVIGLLEYAYGMNAGVTQLAGAIEASQAEAGVQQLAAGAAQVSAGADSLSTNLATAASSAQVMSAGASKLSSGAGSLSAGASQVSAGANELNENVPAIVSGSESLRDGLGKLNDSAGALIAGVQQIVEGASQLASATEQAHDGSMSLKDGLAKFNDEGITKIVDLLDSDLVRATGKLDAVREAGERYTNFSGITDGTSGTVKFVIETDAIEQ